MTGCFRVWFHLLCTGQDRPAVDGKWTRRDNSPCHRRACGPWSRQADACWMERPEDCSDIEDGQHRDCPRLRKGRGFRRCTVSRPDRCLGAPRLPPWPRFKPIAPESASFPFHLSPENLIRNPQGLRHHARGIPAGCRKGLAAGALGRRLWPRHYRTAVTRPFAQAARAPGWGLSRGLHMNSRVTFGTGCMRFNLCLHVDA